MLAAELGVSRNTVREAVRILERSGLVRYRLNHGAVVREPSDSALADLYQARLAMEVGAAWATERAPGAVEMLTAALDALRQALHEPEPQPAINADLDFHETLVACAGSTRLSQAYAPLLNELRLYLTILSTRDEYADAERIMDEHRAIAEAFTAGDRARLAREVSEHVQSNALRVAGVLGDFG